MKPLTLSMPLLISPPASDGCLQVEKHLNWEEECFLHWCPKIEGMGDTSYTKHLASEKNKTRKLASVCRGKRVIFWDKNGWTRVPWVLVIKTMKHPKPHWRDGQGWGPAPGWAEQMLWPHWSTPALFHHFLEEWRKEQRWVGANKLILPPMNKGSVFWRQLLGRPDINKRSSSYNNKLLQKSEKTMALIRSSYQRNSARGHFPPLSPAYPSHVDAVAPTADKLPSPGPSWQYWIFQKAWKNETSSSVWVSKLTCQQDPFSIMFKHLGGPGCTWKSQKSNIYVTYILHLPKQFLVVPPLQESMGVLKPFWLEQLKTHFFSHLSSSSGPKSFQLFLHESYSHSRRRQSTLSLSCCYFMCIFTKTLTSFSLHTLNFQVGSWR